MASPTAREAVAWIACAALAVALVLSRCDSAGGVMVEAGTVETAGSADTSGTIDRARLEEIVAGLQAGGSAWPEE